MSSEKRRRELRQEREERAAREQEERNRWDDLSLFEKIEECDSIYDVKRVLHEIVDELDRSLNSRGGFPAPRKPTPEEMMRR